MFKYLIEIFFAYPVGHNGLVPACHKSAMNMLSYLSNLGEG